jgi:hypothetical protein
MKYVLHEHRRANAVAESDDMKGDWHEFLQVIDSITDDEIIDEFENGITSRVERGARGQKSLSFAINNLLDRKLVEAGWCRQPGIFGDKRYIDKRWKLDFAKYRQGKDDEGTFSVEVAFNHAEALAWVLIKPVLACELNNVEKSIRTTAGILVTASAELKKAGNFDGAVATYEVAQQYMEAMHSILTVPILLVGLKAPDSFYLKKVKNGKITTGIIVRLPVK